MRDDPDSFGEVALAESEDVTSARKNGELGWVIHYQFDAVRDRAIFDLTEVGEISDPVVTRERDLHLQAVGHRRAALRA